MYSLLSSINNICGLQKRQVVKPPASFLRFTMAELLRLNVLSGFYRKNSNRVLHCNHLRAFLCQIPER